MSLNWHEITREDVKKAIQLFIEENPEYPAPRSTFLMYEGRKLPAKHIRGMAYKVRFGVEIKKDEYSGGMETIRFFKRLGFETYHVKKEKQDKISNGNDEECVLETENVSTGNAIEEPVYKQKSIKVGMYLQTEEQKNMASFGKALKCVKASDMDIWVLPENCYVPFAERVWSADILNEDDRNEIVSYCLDLSEDVGRAVVVSLKDSYGTLFSIFANAFVEEEDDEYYLYMKHTMTDFSAFELSDYKEYSRYLFDPVKFKGFRIGLSICYDCNHSIFSRIFGLHGVDLIINSTGGDVVYDKWYKYNKARSIENECYNLVTMGGDGYANNPKCYVYGFNENGGELSPVNICGDSKKHNIPGGIYVYEIFKEPGLASVETSINQKETVNKTSDCYIPVGRMDQLLKEAQKIKDNLFYLKVGDKNIIVCAVEGMEIIKPEKVLPLLYAPELKKYKNCKYIIYNRHQSIEKDFFETKLSLILKVRAMENFCAVVLESDNYNYCYQTGNNRTAQLVQAVNGYYGIDLNRTTGPEAIWRNKGFTKASWRENFEWLIEEYKE